MVPTALSKSHVFPETHKALHSLLVTSLTSPPPPFPLTHYTLPHQTPGFLSRYTNVTFTSGPLHWLFPFASTIPSDSPAFCGSFSHLLQVFFFLLQVFTQIALRNAAPFTLFPFSALFLAVEHIIT